jgi:adenosylcobyric acid synthase
MPKAIAVLGSASDVGKSLVATAICRILADLGVDVVPFKAQNMANQAGVTPDGREMPRAQILQAFACRKMPEVSMGPVLMKPVTPTGAEIVVMGRALGIMEAQDYFRDTSRLAGVADQALDGLMSAHEAVVLEGAGSPVELNLWPSDYVNLRPARRCGAALILVVDIDRGGVFAQAKGTLELMPDEDRSRVIGIIVNRFRGDLSLFEQGIPILEELCRVPVLGVIPYAEHGLDEEDRPFRIPINAPPEPGKLHVGAVLYPRVANTEDLSPLLAEPDLQLTWLTDPRRVREQDLLLFPGSKATLGDLVHITAAGLTEAARKAQENGTWLCGICGGYQMLGETLHDVGGTEGGPPEWPGLGALPLGTRFVSEKLTLTSSFESVWPEVGHTLSGYQIHHGRTTLLRAEGAPLVKGAGPEAGWRQARALGSYLHGLFADDGWRSAFLNQVRRDRGLRELPAQAACPLEQRIVRWTEHVRRSLRPGAIERLFCAVDGPRLSAAKTRCEGTP